MARFNADHEVGPDAGWTAAVRRVSAVRLGAFTARTALQAAAAGSMVRPVADAASVSAWACGSRAAAPRTSDGGAAAPAKATTAARRTERGRRYIATPPPVS